MEKDKKEKTKQVNKKIYTTKELLIRYAKRYLIVLAISVPIILITSYILSRIWSDYTGAVSFFGSFAMLLLACFLGVIYFTKKDDREKDDYDPEDDHDPFAD